MHHFLKDYAAFASHGIAWGVLLVTAMYYVYFGFKQLTSSKDTLRERLRQLHAWLRAGICKLLCLREEDEYKKEFNKVFSKAEEQRARELVEKIAPFTCSLFILRLLRCETLKMFQRESSNVAESQD
eukprot:5105940-Amphidinium_carterae.1